MHSKTVAVFDDYCSENIDGGAKPIVDSIDKTIYEVKILPQFEKYLEMKPSPLEEFYKRIGANLNTKISPFRSGWKMVY